MAETPPPPGVPARGAPVGANPQIPRVELPKGGGAIRGLGEKFAANPVTGTGSMSVPIATSPGRAGFGPALSLSYDSGSGNGPFGFGWSLALPSITRKTDTGLPRYLDHEEADVFLLSGVEDLVPVLHQSGDDAWVPPKIPPRTVDGRTYAIRRYRPRIEGLFARIERWTNIADSHDVLWRSISKDNVTTWYGRTSNSRVADPLDPSRIFSWLICETHDDKGNVVVYDYQREDSRRVFEDATGATIANAHEANRTDVSRSAQRYLKRVRYGNRLPYSPLIDAAGPWPEPPDAHAVDGSSSWHFELVLDYGDHDEKAPTPSPMRAWPRRADPFSRYRSGFDIRTYRICQRALMFHHFPDEAGVGRDCLVSSTDFTFSDEVDPEATRNPVYAFLTAVTHTGYRRSATGYDSRSTPPVEFRYSEPQVSDAVQDVERTSLQELPITLTDGVHRWTDLHGEGVPGILTERDGAWFYERNLSPISGEAGETIARFGAAEAVGVAPTASLRAGAELLDLAGDGRLDVVVFGGATQGFFEHDAGEGWVPFRPLRSPLVRDLRDPNVRLVDLDGDGLADVLVSEDDAFLWHPSLGEEGFGTARRSAKALDEAQGPRVVFADRGESIQLADLSGDGLADIVRIRNGDVCYWPNLGYGRFGAKVTMDRAPWFDLPDQFDPRRLRLADIDGSGTTDILYLHGEGVLLYFNQSGNGWSMPHRLAVRPQTDELDGIVLLDLLGNGTACLVWTSSFPGESPGPTRYIHLMGPQKPHLLVFVQNNLGAETHVSYAPSTKFYLQDKEAGHPWQTRLPFPVHVVERVEAIDRISRTRFVSRFAYHHGCFDGDEREFRGFGMVEQFDTEAFEDHVVGVLRIDGRQETAPELYQPPVITRTWHHTGVFVDEQCLSQSYRSEYYRGEEHLPAPQFPAEVWSAELRECVRALKGMPLREEVYSYDGSPDQSHPYTVTENTFEVRRLQPKGGQRHGVFLVTPRESAFFTYERNPEDPRVVHSFGLAFDELGNALRTCSVVYGRRLTDDALPAEVTALQQHSFATYSETDYTSDILRDSTDVHRLRVPFESRDYEITGIAPLGGLFTLGEIDHAITGADPIDYEVVADQKSVCKRLLSRQRRTFLNDALLPLPLGEWDSLGLQHESFELGLTAGILATQYAGRLSDADLSAAGYRHQPDDAGWWVPSGTDVYGQAPRDDFHLPVGARDAFGIETIATFDRYRLLTESVVVKQALWNTVSVVNDYRLLAPVSMTDPNGNRSAVEHDELGFVVRTAVMGKVGSADGDSLADPTTRFEYDLSNWLEHGQPNVVRTFAREQHGAANTRWQESYTYFTGAGGVAMVKTRANPGKASRVAADGSVELVNADPRWIGNGRTVLNNKGNVVKQYEPYFSVTPEYEDDKTLGLIGVTSIAYYDPLGRKIRTEFPNGTLARVEFNAWLNRAFDANDTVKESRWYQDQGSPDPATQPEPVDTQKRAAWLAAKHADTPRVAHSDSLGRPVYAISDYGGGKRAAARSESDLGGRHSRLFDQLQREVASGFTGIGGSPILTDSAEKGRRWTFHDITGGLVSTWDEYGREFRVEYDLLHRPISSFVKEQGQAEILYNFVVYGDVLDGAQARQLNLLGSAHLLFDTAGAVRVPALDFRGRATSVDRILAKDYTRTPDWSALRGAQDVAAIQAAAAPELELSEVFSAGADYDALQRPTRVTLPDGTVIRPEYSRCGFLASLKAQIRGTGALTDFLKGQDYDAKGQRLFAHHGNDVITHYAYDPQTFRLAGLLRHGIADDPATEALQDLAYSYDPVGNITQFTDSAQQRKFFNNAVVKAENLFEYDALYQLIRATGRELAGTVNEDIRSHGDMPVANLPHANDLTAVRNYTEVYEYDLVGNITTLAHRFRTENGVGSGWTRRYRYAFDDTPGDRTNRLTSTSRTGDPPAGPFTDGYSYDVYGNMTKMPHLTAMEWNSFDQLTRVDLGGGGEAHYIYDAGGQRMRRVVERDGNLNLEWVYLGGVMVFRRRRRDTGDVLLERWTTFIADEAGPIAQVDTKTRDADNQDPANPLHTPLIRYQYANHLGSAVLETDAAGNPISYEEYHPFGTTAYRSSKPGVDLSLKRFRFSGKERDDESGLIYFGLRYYAPWLARWTSADPAGFVDGSDLFVYCHNCPVSVSDPNGTEDEIVNIGKPPDAVINDLHTNSNEARGRLAEYYNDKTYFSSNGKLSFRPGSLTWDIERGQNMGVFDRVDDPPQEPVDEGRRAGSSGSELQGAGGAAIRNNPQGNTIAIPESVGDEKLARLKEGVRQRNVAKNAGPGNSTRVRRAAPAQRAARNEFRTRMAGEQPSPSHVAGHRIDMMYDGTGRVGENLHDYVWEPHATNSEDGREGYRLLRNQPQGEPAGGVARASEAGSFSNSPASRTTGRALGGALAALGLALSGYGLSRDISEGDVPMGAGDAIGVVGGGLELYAFGAAAFGSGGTAIGGVTVAGIAALPLGIALSGLALGITSAIGMSRAAERGDTLGVAAGAVGVAAGTALAVGGAIALASAAGLAMAPAIIAAAPVLIAVGAVLALGVGAFHLGRYFNLW